MFNGGHVVIYSTDADADRRFLKDVVKLDHVDAGHGWLIFALPPTEIAVHPHASSGAHEFYLMCDDIHQAREALALNGIDSAEVVDEGWGVLSSFTLPGGSKVGFYEPRHQRP